MRGHWPQGNIPPPTPGPNLQGMPSRGGISNMRPNQMMHQQQQQQMLTLQQQHQQFLMRQRIIQEQQLQKQRSLRQQEMMNQRFGLNAAINQLQMKTLEQKQQQHRISGFQQGGQQPSTITNQGPQAICPLTQMGLLPSPHGSPQMGLLPPPHCSPQMCLLPPPHGSPQMGLLTPPGGSSPSFNNSIIQPHNATSGNVSSQVPANFINPCQDPASHHRINPVNTQIPICQRSADVGNNSTPFIPPQEPDHNRIFTNVPSSQDKKVSSSDSSKDSSEFRKASSMTRENRRSSSYSSKPSDERGRQYSDRRGRDGSNSRDVTRGRRVELGSREGPDSSEIRRRDTASRDRTERYGSCSFSSSRSSVSRQDRVDSRHLGRLLDNRGIRDSSRRSDSDDRNSSRDSSMSRTGYRDTSEARDSRRSRSRDVKCTDDRDRQGSRYDPPRSSADRRDRGMRSSIPRDRFKDSRTSPIRNKSQSQHRSPDSLRDEINSFDPSSVSKSYISNADSDDPLTSPSLNMAVKEEDESISYYTRSCPADLYFSKNPATGNTNASTRMVDLENRFEEQVLQRASTVRATQEKDKEPPSQPPACHHYHHHACTGHKSSSSSESSSSDDDDDEGDNQIMEEWEKRKKHPYSLNPELWYNIKGQANDGPLCRCSIKSRKSGIRHDVYPGEQPLDMCDMETNNLAQLHHYRVTLSPSTNLLTRVPTLIQHDDHEYIFEGFSLFSHLPLDNVPPCKLLRFNIEYTIHFIPDAAPENFTIRSLNQFCQFLFTEILELIDVSWSGPGGGCQRFHLLPRFSRTLPDSGCKEVLSMNTVLNFLLRSAQPLVEESKLAEVMAYSNDRWRTYVDDVRGMIVSNPAMRPSSIRIDQLDRKFTAPCVTSKEEEEVDKHEPQPEEAQEDSEQLRYPLIIHQGYRPAQLSYAGDPAYRRAWKQYVKFRHLLNSKPKILSDDKQKLKEQEERLQEIRMKKTMKREVTIELISKGFLCTGMRADVCQHALMMPVLMSHLRFHLCLNVLEESLEYKFNDRSLLQLSLTHTSYRTNYGTNPDHTRNSLTNCGMRQVEYGDRRIHYQNTRKRGICILVDIMSRMGKEEETISEIPHNERLEFLGDSVIEFLTSIHLFYMFPWLEEGGLTTYRMGLVQNQHLSLLAKKLKLQDYMLYVHGPDLCHESDLRQAMANCCEAIMGALFLDGGIEVVDKIFSRTLFDDECVLLQTWEDIPQHVLQQAEPGGDRHWVVNSPILKKLESFEEAIGIKFTHIRLLAKAFTHRNIGVNPLTLGHNQRLEFLGDTVLQLVSSEFLYRHYPEHHEGHLSLLRSSLVNSRTQGLVYDDLGMAEYVIFNENSISDGMDIKTKQRADILESFVGALFVDKGYDYCRTFCDVCFFPRLKEFIMNQDWNDPKSQLQQCCLTLREVGGGEPDIPIYKVIESIGPTNTRKYVVAVYFRGTRMATGSGHSIQQAEMAAATNALKKRAELFPILQHQKRFLNRMRKGAYNKDKDMPAEKRLKRNRPYPNKKRRSNVLNKN